MTEDANTYLTNASNPDIRRAFRWEDLDFLVDDPDVIDKQRELLFAVVSFAAGSDTINVIGDDDARTHELLVWSRPDFAGVDSLRILVNDGLRGQDTLLVVVEVTEVPDAPRFILEDNSLRVSRGGSKAVLLEDFVFDPDTPLDSLIIEWDDDPGENFTVEIEEVEGLKQLTFRGKSGFIGDGLFVFRAIDPLDPDLNERIVVNITASEILPPVVAPIRELKIDLVPPGIVVDDPKPLFTIVLDDLVEDPDNQDSELAWSKPFLHESLIDIDENRTLIVQSPLGFVGYEGITFTVTDPNGQTDVLLARIYSSDRRPVAGGLPDLVLDLGQVHREIDLDNYYFDADNIDEEMDWATVDHTSSDINVSIDPISHITTFVVSNDAAFQSLPVVFRVTSRPEGISALDTMFVSVRSGGGGGGSGGSGGGGGPGAIQILPFPSDLQIPVDRFTAVFDLDDFIITPADIPVESISWDVRGGENSIPNISTDNLVSIFGLISGIDTLTFTARDTLGRTQQASTSVRVVGETEVLNLHPIPDVNFIAGQVFNDVKLNNFIIDREAHPDSVLIWSVEFIAPDNNIFVQVNPDTTIFATAPDTGETEVVLTVRNIDIDVVGRDTIRVTSLSPDIVQEELKELAPVSFKAGQTVISVSLNEHLPDAFLPVDGGDPNVKWSVSGQRVTLPIIDTASPHILTLTSVGERVGVDTLSFRAELPGGFTARGDMQVTVREPVDSTTVDLQAIPNPLNSSFLDIYVIARRALEGSPIVLSSFAGLDTTVTLSLIEDDLQGRGVLIWAGNMQLAANAQGTMFFTARALTALGTNIEDTTSIAVNTVTAGKAVALRHNGISVELAPNSVPAGTHIVLQRKREPGKAAAKGLTTTESELELLSTIRIYPAGLNLVEPGRLRLVEEGKRGDGLYRLAEDDRWVFMVRSGDSAAINRLGTYGLLRDTRAPLLEMLTAADAIGETLLTGSLEARIVEAGSGLDPASLVVELDDQPSSGNLSDHRFRWRPEAGLTLGRHKLGLRVSDRAGNVAFAEWSFQIAEAVLPDRFDLGNNYPNPFNPSTSIPFRIPFSIGAGDGVRLDIYNATGQLVRRLIDESQGWEPGSNEVDWDGNSHTGEAVGSGVYLYRLQVGNQSLVRRMTLIK